MCTRAHAQINILVVTARLHARPKFACTREISSKTAILSSMVNISCSRSWSCNTENRSLSARCWFIVCTKIAFMFLFDDITGLCVSNRRYHKQHTKYIEYHTEYQTVSGDTIVKSLAQEINFRKLFDNLAIKDC